MINPVLRQRSFRRLLAALTVSQLGDWLYTWRCSPSSTDRTQSAAWVSATTAARVLRSSCSDRSEACSRTGSTDG